LALRSSTFSGTPRALPRIARTRAEVWYATPRDESPDPPPSNLAAGRSAGPLYSDPLLHDVGPDLDDKVVQGQASGRDWRTTPLRGLRTRTRLLHDGRARSILEAVLSHGGEAETVMRRFRQLPPDDDRQTLLLFLSQL
jgi:CxxC motif-containing protein (DUF1111 family)